MKVGIGIASSGFVRTLLTKCSVKSVLVRENPKTPNKKKQKFFDRKDY